MITLDLILIFIISLKIVYGQVNTCCDNPTVDVKYGTYIGSYRSTSTNVSYASFEGIPFAVPPIGNMRFKDPVMNQDIRGAFNATKLGAICSQPNDLGTEVIGSEDCLTLNLYVPTSLKRPKQGFPVFVYINGGAFRVGNPNIVNPEGLIEIPHLFIGLNHRLGPIGFLSLGTEDVPGNAGLKDQTICLRWVQKNIKYFGGDPRNVLLVGWSSGAVSVRLQQLSPMAKGLFSKAASMSGSALDDWAIQKQPADKAAQLAALLGLNIDDPTFLDNLQSLNVEDIVKASLLVQPYKPGAVYDFIFTPVVEKVFKEKEAIITMSPIEYYKRGKYNHVPSIIGCTTKERLFGYNGNLTELTGIIDNPNVVVPISWHPYLSDDAIICVYKEIILFYFGKLNYDLTDRDDFESAIDVYSDVGFCVTTDESVRELAKTSKEKIYYYIFSFTGVLNGFFMLPYGLIGATHGNELFYIFQFENPRIGAYTADGWTRRRWLKMYENFSKTGNPTPGNCTHLLPSKWLPATKTTQNYFGFNQALTPSVKPAECRTRFWRKLKYKVFSGAFN